MYIHDMLLLVVVACVISLVSIAVGTAALIWTIRDQMK